MKSIKTLYLSDSFVNEDWIKFIFDGSKEESTKGGPGSGNFGHAGRPGHVGGSLPNSGINRATSVFGVRVALPVSLGDYLTAKHYADLGIVTKKPVVTRPEQLPWLKDGYTRIFHGTSAKNLQSILDKGIRFGSNVGSQEALPFIMGVQGESSSFGEVNFAIDFSPENLEKVQEINESWVEIHQEIEPAQIVGVYLQPYRISGEEMDWVLTAMQEYKNLPE
jgi:hypothetical protein